jgi:hypothetical protein
MKKVFISTAILGLTPEETVDKHEQYRSKIKEIIGDYEDMSLTGDFTGIDKDHPPLYWEGHYLKNAMSKAELVIFCGDIEKTRGCKIEKFVCDTYGIPYLVLQDC